MSWTAPRTYVSGEVLTAAIFNTHVRDNLLFLGTHAHSGAAGDGTGDLAGLDSIGWEDAAGDPGVVGTLQRNGSSLAYHDGTGVVVIGGVAAAGTPSARALGSANGTQGANGTHLHTLIEQAIASGTSTGGTSVTFGIWRSAGATTSFNMDVTLTATGTSRLVGYGVAVMSDGSTGSTTLLLDGTLFATGSGNDRRIESLVASKVVPSGTYVVRMRYRSTGGTSRFVITAGGLVSAIGTPA